MAMLFQYQYYCSPAVAKDIKRPTVEDCYLFAENSHFASQRVQFGGNDLVVVEVKWCRN